MLERKLSMSDKRSGEVKEGILERVKPIAKDAARVVAAGSMLIVPASNRIGSPEPGELSQLTSSYQLKGESLGTKTIEQAVQNVLNATAGRAEAQTTQGIPQTKPFRVNLPIASRESEAPRYTEIQSWYLNAQEVPGTRLTNTLNGKNCLMRSIVEPTTNYWFKWVDKYDPTSIPKVTNFMCEDEVNRGFDELVLAAFTSYKSIPASIKTLFYGFSERQPDGSYRSYGYFANLLFEVNGRKIRMTGYAPPDSGVASDIDFIRTASMRAALDLSYVSVAGDTDPRQVTLAQSTRLRQVEQDYVNIVEFFAR